MTGTDEIIRKKRVAKSSSERGVALIFTLGLLGIITMIALLFAGTAMTERKVSGVNHDAQAAKFLAKSALERVEGALFAYTKSNGGFTALQPDRVRSYQVGNNADTYDWIWKLETPGIYKIGTYSTSTYPTWQYVTNPVDNKIIGRFAYVAVAGQKIDVASVLDTKYDPPSAVLDPFHPNKRLGISTRELAINTLPQLDYTSLVQGSLLSGGSLQSNMKLKLWEDSNKGLKNMWPGGMDDIVAAMNTTPSPALSGDYNQLAFRKFFEHKTSKVSESFQVTSGNYHRFNLIRNDWDADTMTVDQMVGAPAVWNASTTSNAFPFLRTKVGEPAKDVQKKKQIAANIIQYNLPLSAAVVTDETDWETKYPSYTGNKRTPYINELLMRFKIHSKVEVTWTAGENPSPIYTWNLEFFPEAHVELRNMYSGMGTGYTIKLVGSISCVYTMGGDPVARSWNLNSEMSQGATKSNGESNGKPYGNFATYELRSGNTKSASAEGPLTLTVSKVKFRIEKIILKSNDDNLDLVEGPVEYEIAGTHTQSTPGGVGVGVPAEFNVFSLASFNRQATDPRNNLMMSDSDFWSEDLPVFTLNKGSDADALQPTINMHTLNSGNGGGTPPEGKETSPAFIRHHPMTSPCELGLIHRARPWETLNLRKARRFETLDEGVIVLSEYDKGDAQLYDMIKTTSEAETAGKLNLRGTELFQKTDKTSCSPVLNTLLTGINRITDIGDSISVGSEAICSDPKKIIDLLSDTTNNQLLKRRSDILAFDDVSCLVDPNGTGGSDFSLEEYVGRFIALTKVEPLDSVTIIIVAQTIKDVGGVTILKDWDNKGGNAGPTTLAGLKAAGYVRFDSETDTKIGSPTLPGGQIHATFGIYDNGADPITGESKIIAQMEYDAVVGKWKVVRYAYID